MKLLASQGNLKLGKDTLILNMTSATDCPSRKLGLCKIGNRCYAMKAERLYKSVLPFRRAQECQWQTWSVPELTSAVTQKRGVHFVRFSESGDFRSQNDVDKMSMFADILKYHHIRVYGYTAREDLDFSQVSDNMVVNGSGFMIHNQFTATPIPTGTTCPMNCRYCSLCKEPNGFSIEVKYH